MTNNPILMTDGYKLGHHRMYPEGTELVYSNFTPRGINYMPKGAEDIVVFGTQYTVQYIQDLWQNNFFNQPKEQIISQAKKYFDSYLGTDYDMSHFEALHDLGYLPVCIKSLEEGSIIGPKIPILTIYNTKKEFFWLPNFLETLISSLLWKPLHSASLAYGFRKILDKWALKTDKENLHIVDFQGHDFSFRGMQHPESAISSGLGWLTSFSGTDSIPVLQAADYYYDSTDCAFSVPASEHAVMTAYGKEDEIEGFRRLMKQYPTGILSIVSDSFDLWKVCTEYLPELRDKILARDGKIVIRPDSGNPVDILCGEQVITRDYRTVVENASLYLTHPKYKGVIELLWDVFGGTVNEQGYKVLDPHIGAIYGDSITLERAEEICSRLEAKGFASTNWVAGIGSYSLGYATRDSQGSAVKATYCVVNGEGREIFKDPITDDGLKKSAKGLLYVQKNTEDGKFELIDQVDWETENKGELDVIFINGGFVNESSLYRIKERIKKK